MAAHETLHDNDDDDGAQLKRSVLSEQVKSFVIDLITTGELKPGDRMVTSSLARTLGVSQAPVREAIRDLVLLGFLENRPFKGTYVRSFSPKDLNEVYSVRGALESLAARLAADQLTDDDLETLRHTLDGMIEAAQAHDEEQMIELDNRFHELILKISGNQLLYQVYQTLQFGLWTIVTARASTYDLEALARRHEVLLEALASRDPHRAMVTMQRHLEDLRKSPPDPEARPA